MSGHTPPRHSRGGRPIARHGSGLHRRATLAAGVLAALALLASAATCGIAAHAGVRIDGGIVGWTGVHMRVWQPCPFTPIADQDTGNGGCAWQPRTVVCRLTREPLGVAHPHLAWPHCTVRSL